MGLTVKQEAFCQHAAFMSYADAYRAVYVENPGPYFRSHIDTLVRDHTIAMRIIEIQAAAPSPVKNAHEFLLNWWFQRLVYDPAEISAWVRGACRYCHGDGHAYQWRVHEYFEKLLEAETYKQPLPDLAGGFGYNSTAAPIGDCPDCHGKGVGRTDFSDTRDLSRSARAAFEGVKQTKDGLEIRMADKGKAAEQFAKLSGLDVIQVRSFTDNIPSGAELERLRADPNAAAAVYKAIIQGGRSNTPDVASVH